MKPQLRSAALGASPLADAPKLMDEYEQLLAERFARDPDAPTPLKLGQAHDPEDRIKQLHDLLFGPLTP